MLKLRNMIQNKYFNFSTVIFLLTGSFAWSQFVEINAELDMRRLSEGDRQLFDTMADDIENYYLNTQFSADVSDLEMVIDIRLVLESVSRGGSQTTINAQAIFSNKLDQYYKNEDAVLYDDDADYNVSERLHQINIIIIESIFISEGILLKK